MREQFLRPLDPESIKSLEDLNVRFHTWVETEYHRTPHRGLNGKTPLESWLEKAKYIIRMDSTIDLDEVFFHETSRKVYKDSTFTLEGVLYEVPSILATKRISIRYDVFLPAKRPFIYFQGKSYGEARIVDTYANSKVKRSDIIKGDLTLLDNEPENNKTHLHVIQASLSASKIDLSEGRKSDE